MENVQFAKQTLSFQKTVFENSFNAMVMAQDQMETVFSGFIEQLPWATDESKKSMQTSMGAAKKARDDFKKAVEEGFTRFEGMLESK